MVIDISTLSLMSGKKMICHMMQKPMEREKERERDSKTDRLILGAVLVAMSL